MKILYEDSNILAIDKPSGILAHPALEQAQYGAGPNKTSKEKTILDWALSKYPKAELVHRLDRETSGVMLIAKNAKAHEFLKQQFSAPALALASGGTLPKQDRINKVYVAIVSGHVRNDRGVINKPIGRSPKDFRRYSSGRGARGEMREAITEYRVVKRFLSGKNKFTYIEARPKTGRTHQIRVHMKYLNHPVACDTLYNPDGFCPRGIKRMALHAHFIEFKDLKGKIVKVESPIPKEFEKVVK